MKYGKACLMSVHLSNVRLKDPAWGCPYIAKAKCDTIINGTYDNGRVLTADDIIAVYNEIDFVILESEYDFEFEILELYVARKQKLPKSFRDLILSEYEAKTQLKGGDAYRYGKVKNRFNALYGMTVQNPIKPNIKYNDTGKVIKLKDDTEIPPGALYEDFETPLESLMKDYHDKGWIPYQVGVWVSSYARLHLERGMSAIDPEAFLYCDTDSIKFVGNYDDAFEEINASIRNETYSAVDRKGVRHYMGVFEKETSDEDPILRFKTMGAKKYAYEDSHGLHLTLAGVGKKSGAAELGTLDNFRSGFVFRNAAGTESVYNDQMEPRILTYKGHRLELSSNIYIRESEYTLDLDYEYRKMLSFLATTDIRYSMHYER